ncbi:hypothetical protein VTO42DRAFT_2714 [Malbranchea cinnamomea]
MPALPAIPLLAALQSVPPSLAAPAVVTSLAYLNARWSFSYDLRLLFALTRTVIRRIMRTRQDRLNLFYFLEEHAQNSKNANRPFIVFQGKTWTFHEAYQTTLRYGTWLKRRHGVKSGEVVAMDFMNSAAFIFVWMGLLSIGAVPAFINYNLAKAPLTHCVKVSTARLLLVDGELRHAFPPEQLDIFAAPDFREKGGSVEVVFYDAELEAEILNIPPVREPDSARGNQEGPDIGMLIYTSGTTGMPKPAIVSWNKCIMGGSFVSLWMGLKSTDRVYTCMPLYHSTAAILAYVACLISATTIIIGRKFSARKFWDEVRENDATVIQYVGETMRYLLAVPPKIDPVTGENLDKQNKVWLMYGNGLRPDVWNRVKERFGIDTVAEFYASTEGTSGTWNLSSNDFSSGAIGRSGSIAELILRRSVTIVELDHVTEAPRRDPKTGLCRAVPRGEPGELLYRVDPENIREQFQGYFNNKKATDSKILRDVLEKGDAWFRTGDVVRWDKEGRWYFSDRIGDTFRWKSENVSTSEVAEVLGSHPDLHETNVYGVKLPNHEGRAGCAAIVLKDQAAVLDPTSKPIIVPTSALLNSLATHALGNLPRYAVPVFLRVMREMQATGNNKQQKHVLRTEGVNPEALEASKSGDLLYWLKDGTYVPFGKAEWDQINAGQVKL